MVANVGRIVTRSARTRKRRQSQYIVNTGHIHYVDRLRIEDVWPRAMLARAAFPELTQASNKLNIAGLKGVPNGLKPKLAGNESLMPTKKDCEASAAGPPFALLAFSGPA